jgi:hypothetical protein
MMPRLDRNLRLRCLDSLHPRRILCSLVAVVVTSGCGGSPAEPTPVTPVRQESRITKVVILADSGEAFVGTADGFLLKVGAVYKLQTYFERAVNVKRTWSENETLTAIGTSGRTWGFNGTYTGNDSGTVAGEQLLFSSTFEAPGEAAQGTLVLTYHETSDFFPNPTDLVVSFPVAFR